MRVEPIKQQTWTPWWNVWYRDIYYKHKAGNRTLVYASLVSDRVLNNKELLNFEGVSE